MYRSIITIDDLSNDEILEIFELAERYLHHMVDDPAKPNRIKGRLRGPESAEEFVLASLFQEPSTRTRFSFESAMIRLGGSVIASADASNSSSSKGESLADTVRVIESYADIVVMRNPGEGAARVAADFTSVPIVNGGDGSHEHPTQTLCDLFTLMRGRQNLQGISVAVCGDLRNGRTVHSLVYGLARFGAEISPMPAPGLELPEHVTRRLLTEHNQKPEANGVNNVIYRSSSRPHQLTLFEASQIVTKSEIDPENFNICYVTRFQRERLELDPNRPENYPVIDKEFLKDKRYKHARVLHPLPRVDELSYDLDDDPRGLYFQQASLGVPVRMALIAKLLGIGVKPLPAKSPRKEYPLYPCTNVGLHCANPKCVTRTTAEKRYLTGRFWLVSQAPTMLRCVYCEYEVEIPIMGNRASRKYRATPTEPRTFDPNNWIFFLTEEQARTAGFEPCGTHHQPAEHACHADHTHEDPVALK